MKKLTKYLMFLCVFLSVNFQNISAVYLSEHFDIKETNILMETLIDSVDKTLHHNYPGGWWDFKGYGEPYVESNNNFWGVYDDYVIAGYAKYVSGDSIKYVRPNKLVDYLTKEERNNFLNCIDVWDIDTLKDGSSMVVFVSDSGVYSVEVKSNGFYFENDWVDDYGDIHTHKKWVHLLDTILINPLSKSIQDGYRIHSDREGAIWVATKTGLAYLKNNSDNWNILTYKKELPNERIENIISDKNNRIMVVTTKSAYTIKNNAVEKQYTLSLNNTNDSISYGCFDTKNNLLVGTNFGVYYLENDAFKLIDFFNDSNIYTALEYTNSNLHPDFKYSKKSIFVDEKYGTIYLINYPFGLIKLKDIKSEPVYDYYDFSRYIDEDSGNNGTLGSFSIVYFDDIAVRLYDKVVNVMTRSTNSNVYLTSYRDSDVNVWSCGIGYSYPWVFDYFRDGNFNDAYNQKYHGAIQINRKDLITSDKMFTLTFDGRLMVTLSHDFSSVSTKETEETNSEKIIIYPNPVSDIITIKSSIKGNTFIATKEGNLIKEIKNETANIKDLPKGVYFGVIKSNGKIKGVKSFYKK